MDQKFSIKASLEQLEACLNELNGLLVYNEIPDHNRYKFDRTLISMIEICLLLKVHRDRPEVSFNPDLLKYLTLTGKDFSYSQTQIIFGQQDDISLPRADK